VVNGGISGESRKLGVAFRAREAKLSFPPDKYNPALEELTLNISGGIALADTEGKRFQADEAVLSGADRTLNIPGRVRAALPLDIDETTQARLGQPNEMLQIEGYGLLANVDEERGIQSIRLGDIRAASDSIDFSASQVLLTNLEQERDGSPLWQFSVEQGPVNLLASGIKEELSASSESADILLDTEGLSEARLSGNVEAWSGQAMITGESVSIVPTDGRFSSSVGSVTIHADIAAISGMTPINVQEKLQQGSLR
jgi:hypothetical protein